MGLVVSVLGTVTEFASNEFDSLVGQLPDLTVIIEHLAGVKSGEEPPYTAFKKVLNLSNYPNTYVKVGGLGEIAVRPTTLGIQLSFDRIPPLIEMVLEAFTTQRMMWGSDYPPVSGREGYRNALLGVREHPAFEDQQDREWV
ncbi:MAG: hypothetical protein CFH02_01076, partial [Alphaproteobacteria bacterium MarineAlpha3_Bin1]